MNENEVPSNEKEVKNVEHEVEYHRTFGEEAWVQEVRMYGGIDPETGDYYTRSFCNIHRYDHANLLAVLYGTLLDTTMVIRALPARAAHNKAFRFLITPRL